MAELFNNVTNKQGLIVYGGEASTDSTKSLSGESASHML